MSTTMSRFLSQKLRFYTFLSIALLLAVHGYNLHQTYLQPFTTVKENLTFTTFFEYFMANGVLRFRIPLLFIISGYIYAGKDDQPYSSLIKKRAKTLLVPYLIWSAVGLLITYLWQQYPVTAQAVLDAKLDQMGDDRPYREIGWTGIITRWLLAPISFQLWFILALFLTNLIYPFIRWCLSHFALLWFIVTFLLWVFELGFFVFDGRGLFFFSLGVWLQKTNFNLEKKPKWLSLYIAWLVFVGFSVIKTFMAFELEPAEKPTFIILTFLHNMAVLSGILAVWFGADSLVKWCIRQHWFVWLSAFSFFIFGLHAPLVVYVTRLLHLFISDIPDYRLITYLLVPALVFFFCVGAGALVRKYLPGFYRLATGGRGF